LSGIDAEFGMWNVILYTSVC